MNELKSIGICCGSLVQADFRSLVEAASGAGFGSISLWPTLFFGALDAGLSAQDMRSMLNDTGLQVTELDPFSSWLPVDMKSDDLGAVFHAFTEDDFFRMADSLGARSLNIIQQSPAIVSDARRAELINALSERAARHGLLVTIEFLPWSPIGSLGQAQALVAAVDHPNFGINIDTWHHFRSGGTLQDIAAADPETICAVQFNDLLEQPWDNLLEETALARLPPGEGHSDSIAVYRTLLESGVDAPVSVEVFSAELMALPAQDAAARLAESMKRVLAGVNACRTATGQVEQPVIVHRAKI